MSEIILATSRSDVDAARRLFAEYAASLDIDLGFQGFASELEELPGEYVPPSGALLLAMDGEEAVGCAALRPFEAPSVAEIKRLSSFPPHAIGASASALPRRRSMPPALQGTPASVSTPCRRCGPHSVCMKTSASATSAYRHNPHEARYLELEL